MKQLQIQKIIYSIIVIINIGILSLTDFSRISFYHIFERYTYESLTGLIATFTTIHSISILIWITVLLFHKKENIFLRRTGTIYEEIRNLEKLNKIYLLEIQKYKLEIELNKNTDDHN